MGDQEDMLCRKQLSTAVLYNLNNIWNRKNRIREHVLVKLYKTIVKAVLMYNSQKWVLTVNDEHNLDSFHRQQLRTALHIKFPHVICNSDLYQRTNEIPLTLAILKNRWKLFGHILVFAIWGFFYEHSRFTAQQGKGEAISLTPLYHFHPLHRHLDISWANTGESSPLHVANSRIRTMNLWFPNASR